MERTRRTQRRRGLRGRSSVCRAGGGSRLAEPMISAERYASRCRGGGVAVATANSRWLAGVCVGCLLLLARCAAAAAAQPRELAVTLGVTASTQARDGSSDFAQGLRDCNAKEKRRAACLDGHCVSLQTSSVNSYLICRCPAGRMGRRCEERSPSPEMITLMAQRLSEMPKEVRCHSINYNILMKGGYESSFVECLKYEEQQEYQKKVTPAASGGGARSVGGGASRPPKRKKTTTSKSLVTPTSSAATTSAATSAKPSHQPPSPPTVSSRSPSPPPFPSKRPHRQRPTTGVAQPPATAASLDGVTFAAAAHPESDTATSPRLKIRRHRVLRV